MDVFSLYTHTIDTLTWGGQFSLQLTDLLCWSVGEEQRTPCSRACRWAPPHRCCGAQQRQSEDDLDQCRSAEVGLQKVNVSRSSVLFNLWLWYFPSWEMWWKTCPSVLTFKWIISAEQPNLRRSRRQLLSWRVLEYRRTCPLMQNHTRCTMMNNAHNENCIYLNSCAATGLFSWSDMDEM